MKNLLAMCSNLNHSIIVAAAVWAGKRRYDDDHGGPIIIAEDPNLQQSIPSRAVSHGVMDGFTLHAISLRGGTNASLDHRKESLGPSTPPASSNGKKSIDRMHFCLRRYKDAHVGVFFFFVFFWLPWERRVIEGLAFVEGLG
jgi:hypothetical protein